MSGLTQTVSMLREGRHRVPLVSKILGLPGQSVYSKALTLFVAFSLLLGAAVVLLTSEIILREFRETERQEMIATLQRFTLVLARETRPMEISVADWLHRNAPAGDTLTDLPEPGALAAMQLDFLSLAERDGHILATSFRDETARQIFGQSDPWPAWMVGGRGAPLPSAGFILMQDSLVAICLVGAGQGRVLAGGRIFDAESLSFLEGMFGARIAFKPLREVSVSTSDSNPILRMLANNEFYVRTPESGELVGSVLVRGINGIPIGQIQLTQGRPLYAEGLRAVQVFLTVLTLAGGTLFAVMWLLLDRTILTRIRDLTRKVERQRESLPLSLDFRGSDELATLARRIEDLALQLDRARWNYRAVVEDQNEIICRFSPGFAITFCNRIFQRTFPHDPEKNAFLQVCLPQAAFELLAKKFEDLTPADPLATFNHQIPAGGTGPLWLRSTLRANFRPDGSCAGGQWVAADITSQILAQQQLQESEHQLRTLSTHLLRLQDHERRKIARELHDSTAQSLSALEMNMSLLEPLAGDETTRRIVAETRQIARDCCLELRTISYLLHPPLLDEVGLPFAVEWFAEGFSKRTSIEVRTEIPEDFPRLDPEVETTLFRIVQEAMSNIYRHSGATRAWISLASNDLSIEMEIRDNGTGFRQQDGNDPEASGGVGFAGMRERLAPFGGRLKIRSSPYGVSILVSIDRHAISKEENPHR